MTDYRVKIDGLWAEQYAHVSAVTYSTRHASTGPCGPMLASCAVDVDPSNDSSWLMLGKVFELYVDGVKEFGGKVSEMGRGVPRQIHAKGWARILGGESDNAAAFGRTAENVAFTPADPTTPTWFLDASGLDIGVADDRLYTQVVATYVSAVTGDPPEPSATDEVTVDDAAGQALFDVIPYDMDLTPLGLMSSATATTYAQAQLDEFTIPEWLSRVTVTSAELLSLGGLPAHLPSVKAGQMVRLFNVPNNLGGIRNELALDVVLGEVEHDSDQPDQVTIAPKRLAARNIADALVAQRRAA